MKNDPNEPGCKLTFFSWNWPFIIMWTIYVAVIATVAFLAACTISPETAAAQADLANRAATVLTGSPAVGRAVGETWNALLWGLGIVTASTGAVAAKKLYSRRKRKDPTATQVKPTR